MAAARPGGLGERQRRVQELSAALRGRLGPYEPLLSAAQAALVWERPGRSALWWAAAHGLFWFFALTSLRLLFLVALTLIVVVCLDQWKNKIWPEIGVARPDELDNESWGYVHPRLLGVPELCHHLAEGWVAGTSFLSNLFIFKRQNPGKFCLLVCGVFTFLAVLGRYIPGLVLSYLLLLFILLWPLAVYHRLGQRMYMKLEPALQRLDFSVRGYMISKQREKQLRRRSLNQEAVDDGSDSEEELAAFCPKLDDSVVAKELTISDSEHSDAEVSYTENGMFNLSRGQTPLTEGSEDLDGHSDPEESFARDLPDFPSINPEATGIDDEDDTSIGIPSLAYRPQVTEDLRLPYDQEDSGALPSVQNLTNNIAGFVTRGMIQLALSGAPQPCSSRSDNPQRGAKTYLRTASSDLDTDAEGDDFELLDQSELNQLDPAGSRGHRPWAVVKALEQLAQQGRVREKAYGKQKIYFADQEQLPAASDAELRGLDGEITALSSKVQALQQSCRQMEAELKDLNSSMTTPEIAGEIEDLRKDCASYTEKLERIKSATNHVTPEEKEKVCSEQKLYCREWRRRKRMATELLEAILEGYPKSKKQFFEEVGIETDEDHNVTLPAAV